MSKKKESNGLSTLVGVGICLYVGVHFHVFSHISSSTGSFSGTATYQSGTLSCKKLESLWVHVGGRRSKAFIAAEVAKAESGGYEYAKNVNSNGTVDIGYWQINSSHGSESSYDPLTNAHAAVRISRNGRNWTPWTTYNSGAYIGKC